MKITSREDCERYFERRYRWVAIPSARWFRYDYARIVNLSEKEMACSAEPAMMTAEGGPDCDKIEAARRVLVAHCWVDAKGLRLFDPTSKDDLVRLGGMDGRVIETLYKASRDHCGYIETDIAALASHSDVQSLVSILPLLVGAAAQVEQPAPEVTQADLRLRSFAKDWTSGKVNRVNGDT